MQPIIDIANNFLLAGNCSSAVPHGSGHIHTTYLLHTDKSSERSISADNNEKWLDRPWMETSALDVCLTDHWQGCELRISSSQSCDTGYYPVYTVSSSEGGFEKTYQGGCILLGYQAAELPDRLEISLEIREISK